MNSRSLGTLVKTSMLIGQTTARMEHSVIKDETAGMSRIGQPQVKVPQRPRSPLNRDEMHLNEDHLPDRGACPPQPPNVKGTLMQTSKLHLQKRRSLGRTPFLDTDMNYLHPTPFEKNLSRETQVCRRGNLLPTLATSKKIAQISTNTVHAIIAL